MLLVILELPTHLRNGSRSSKHVYQNQRNIFGLAFGKFVACLTAFWTVTNLLSATDIACLTAFRLIMNLLSSIDIACVVAFGIKTIKSRSDVISVALKD